MERKGGGEQEKEKGISCDVREERSEKRGEKEEKGRGGGKGRRK